MHSSDKAMKLYCVSFFFLHLQWLFIRQMNFSLSISWILKRFLTAQVLREKEYFAIKWTFMILRGKSIWQNHFHKQFEKYRWLTKCYLYSPWAIAEIWNWVAPEWLGKIRQQAEESRGHHQDSLHTQTFSWKGYISKDIDLMTETENESLSNIWVYLLTMIPAPVIMPIRKLGTREATTIMRLSITEMQANILRQKNT